MKGVDISHYQEGLTIRQIRDAGNDFVIIKLTEGNFMIDSAAFGFYHEAFTLGFPVGCYCYSHAVTPEQARREAEFLLKTINGFPMPCGVFLDIEKEEQLALSKEQLLTIIEAWCATIAKYEYIPGIYSSEGTLWAKISKEDLPVGALSWVAKWSSSKPSIICDIWQNSDRGRIGGYGGLVDTDVALSDRFKMIVRNANYNVQKETTNSDEEVADACPIEKPEPAVMMLQMVMSYKGYWGEANGYKSKEFIESLHCFVDDLERGII